VSGDAEVTVTRHGDPLQGLRAVRHARYVGPNPWRVSPWPASAAAGKWKYRVEIHHGQGIQIGDHDCQVNVFTTPPAP
jgi:RIP homotypic interaction motif